MLKGTTVILRAYEREDIKRIHELARNVDLALLGDGYWEPEPLARMEKHFEKELDEEEKSHFVIEVDGSVIGQIALHHRNRRDGVTQLGIGIYDPESVNKGYGRDAINTLLRWAFHIQNYRRVWLETIATNDRATRAYLACGFQEEGRLRQHAYVNGVYVDILQMGLLRSDWEARQAAS